MVDETPPKIPIIPAKRILKRIQEGKKVRLKNSIIEGDLDVSKLDLPKKNGKLLVRSLVEINNSQIKGIVNFENIILENELNLYFNQFDGSVYFTRVTFDEYTDFTEAVFNGFTDFFGATFSKGGSFSKTNFCGGGSFGEVNFGGETYFNGARFIDDIAFNNVTFRKDSEFNGAIFNECVNFSGATFCWDAEFNGAIFNECVDFSGATFCWDAEFNGASFHKSVNFNGIFCRKLDLEESKIDSMHLSNANFKGAHLISLKSSDFVRLVVRWDSIRGKIEYDDTAYLALVKNFNNLGLFDDADKCYYEYRTFRRMKLKGIIPKLLDYAAWLAYGYGVRPRNPLILSLGLFLISIFVFLPGFELQEPQEPFGSMINATSLSLFVFTSSPKTDPLTGLYGIWGMIERIAGWLLMSCFLVVLAKKTLR